MPDDDPTSDDLRQSPDDPGSGAYVPPPAPLAGSRPPPMPGPYAGGPAGYGPPGYGQPGYGQPGYGQPYGYGMPPGRNGFGVASLVLGIIGLVTSLFVLGIVPGVLAIVFGVLGRARARRHEASNGGMAIAGIVLGVLAVIAAIGFIVLYAYVHKHCIDVDGHLHCDDPNYPKT